MVFKVKHENWISNNKQLCGPIRSSESYQYRIDDYLIKYAPYSITYIYEFFISWPFIILALVLLSANIQFKWQLWGVTEKFINDQLYDYQSQEATLIRLNQKKQNKVDIMQRQVDAEEKDRQVEIERRKID